MKERYFTEWRHKIWEQTGWNYECPVCGKPQDDADIVGYSETSFCYDSKDWTTFVKCRNCGKRWTYQDGT